MRLARVMSAAFVAVIFAFFVQTAAARVVRVEITSRSDVNQGKPFGLAGPYERIQGRVYFAVSPRLSSPRETSTPSRACRSCSPAACRQ